MINLKLTPDFRRKKKDNTYPLVFRISANGMARDVKTGFSVSDADWNCKKSFIKESHSEYKILAPRITELKLEYLTKLVEYEKTNQELDIQEIKNFLISKPKRLHTVYTFWQAEVEQLYRANRQGGAQVYKEALAAVHKVKSLEISFSQLDYNFLKHVEVEFLSRGVKLNTIGVHYRALRAIFNKAINSKLVGYEHYPFRAYKIKKEATVPRAISMADMRKYFSLDLAKSSPLYDSWLLGKFMFMLMGINFKDMVLLSISSLKGDRLLYKRAKTRTLYSIKLLPEAQQIIEHFKCDESKTLLCRLSNSELDSKEKFTLIIRQKNKVFNAHLNKLGKIIGCSEKLTGYVFRYTWANIAKQLDYSRDMIAEGLGHQYGNKITGIYLECFDLELVDEMNSKVFKAVCK